MDKNISKNNSEEKINEDKAGEVKIEKGTSDETKSMEEKPVEDKPEEKKAMEERSESPEESDREASKEEKEFDIPFIDPTVYTYNEKKKKKKRVLPIVILGILGLILMAYLGGVVYFSTHFGTNVFVNGRNVSGMTAFQVDDILETEMSSYEFTIKYKNGNDIIRLGDGNLTATRSESALQLMAKQNPFLWFINYNKQFSFNVTYDVTYDEAALRERIASSTFMDESQMIPSTNAEVVMEEGKVLVVPDVTGTEFDKEQVLDIIMGAIEDGVDSISIEAEECYYKAEITTDSEIIKKSAESANNYLSIDACYDFLGYIYTIPKEDMCDMAYLDEDGTIKLSKTNIEAWAKKFATENTTVDKPRKFRTNDGQLIYVEGVDSDYGWELNPEQEAIELYECMCTMESFTKKPAVIKEGYAWWELNDIGSSYVEIDLSDQMVYVYQEGKRVYETPCVSGNDDYIHRTPGGLYGLTYKAYHAILRGEDYASPVTFWMPFNKDIGLHDATWRADDNYTPDRYTWDGSHGCVNLPYAAASYIFDYVEEGSPIVCYWEEEVTHATLED